MIEMPFLSDLPGGSLHGGIELANEMSWNLSTSESDGKWAVIAGDQLIFRSDNLDSFEAFIYGLSLVYSVLPEEKLKDIRKTIDDM